MVKLADKKYRWFVAALAIALVPLLHLTPVHADQLTSRQVRIIDSKVSATTSHIFSFGVPTASSVGSIVFEYCSNSPLIGMFCTVPSGLDVTGAGIDFESGETGFAIDGTTTSNRLVLTRPASVTNVGPTQLVFSNIINPDTSGTTYVRITLHASADGSGPSTDEGSVAFANVSAITTTAYVPPFLIFCVGITVASDCSSATGFFIDLGEFSTSSAATGTSQFAGATNDGAGFSVSIHGTTLTSGNNTIPALGTPDISSPGVSQFGINLRDNANPNVGANRTGGGSSVPTAQYNAPNQFTFENGEIISNSNVPTVFNVMTVSYMANVSDSQPAGVYNATYTYVATAAF